MTKDRLKNLPVALRRKGHDGPACRVASFEQGACDEVAVLCGCGAELEIFWGSLVRAEECWCEKDQAEDRGIVCPRCWTYLASPVDDPPCGQHLCGRRVGHLGPCMTSTLVGTDSDRQIRICLTVPEPPAPNPGARAAEKLAERDAVRAQAESGPSSVATAPAARPRLTIACQGDWE